MTWKPLKIGVTLILVLLMAVFAVQAKNENSGDNGPPADTPFTPEFFWMTGTVQKIDLYELKETLYFYDQDGFLVTYYIPVDEPDQLYILTATEASSYDADGDGSPEWSVVAGEKYLLDFGPEWYSADPCLIDSWVCDFPAGTEVPLGPYVVGIFDCAADTVVSNDINHNSGAYIPLMSRAQLGTLPDASTVYAYGRIGGSEIVWLHDSDDDGVYELYEKAGANIIWEMSFDSSQNVWWRGEAPPQAMTSELNCSISGD